MEKQKREVKFFWLSEAKEQEEETAVLSFREGKKEILRFEVYPLGETEAQIEAVQAQKYLELLYTEKKQEIVIQEVTEMVEDALDSLRMQGFGTAWFALKKGNALERILDSTNVVPKMHSEYMMYCENGAGTGENAVGGSGERVFYTETESGYDVKNREGSFFCRLSPFRGGFYVYEVEVAEKERGKGIATECMTELMRRFPKLYLQVGSYNVPAMCLYKKLKFEVIEEVCFYGEEE